MKFYSNYEKKETSEVLYDLGIIPLLYGGNIDKFQKLINNIIEKYQNYENFINNYFINLRIVLTINFNKC